MKKFVKGLLFGSIVGGTIALLTTKELSEEIMEDVQNFKHMSQPRIKRIQAHLSTLRQHIEEATKEKL